MVDVCGEVGIQVVTLGEVDTDFVFGGSQKLVEVEVGDDVRVFVDIQIAPAQRKGGEGSSDQCVKLPFHIFLHIRTLI